MKISGIKVFYNKTTKKVLKTMRIMNGFAFTALVIAVSASPLNLGMRIFIAIALMFIAASGGMLWQLLTSILEDLYSDHDEDSRTGG